MKTIKMFVSIIIMIFVATSCELNPSLDMDLLGPNNTNSLKSMAFPTPKATGFVEFVWKGGQKGGDMGNKPDALLAFFEFNAHEATPDREAKGEIIYTVTNLDTTLHREIRAEVFDVLVDYDSHKAWFIGKVISDTKGCDGNGGGGHDSGCGDDGHTDDGGCGDDGHTDDGGCGDDGHTDDGGGCGDDTSHDGGCSHDDTGEDGSTHDDTGEGGCSGDTGTDTHSGGMGGDMGGGSPGGSGMGNPLSGKNCRIGQIIAVKIHDVATPGIAGDGLTWKWFSPEGIFVPSTDNIPEWPHLCKKIIVDGNLVIH